MLALPMSPGGLPTNRVHGAELTTFQVVDLFSGCGGVSFGFSTAKTVNTRFQVLGGLDIDPHANATYERMIGVKALHLDIRELAKPGILRKAVAEWSLDRSKPLVLIGCAPCQGFSSHRKKDDRADDRNTLLSAFATVALSLRPSLIVMENVPEMLHVKHWNHFNAWQELLIGAGYSIRTRIYNLAQFGVPQERFRTLVLAVAGTECIPMPTPTHSSERFVNVRQAIGHLPPLQAGDADPSDPMHITSRHRPATVELIRQIPPDGGSRRALPKGVGPMCLQSVDGFRDVYGRLWWDRPAVAITARCRTSSCGRYIHPEQHRGLSIREAALLQGFPHDYAFEGPFDDKFKQVGNAVCPPFSRAIAEHLDFSMGSRCRQVDTG